MSKPCLLFLAMVLLAIAAPAQDKNAKPKPAVVDPAKSAPKSLTLDDVARLRQAAENDSSLDEAAKARVKQIYDEAEKQLKAAADFDAKAQQFQRAAEAAPQQLAALEKSPGKQMASVGEMLPEKASLAEWEAIAQAAETDRSVIEQRLTQLRGEPAQRGKRRGQIPDLLVNARGNLDEAQSMVLAAPPAGDQPRIGEAQQTADAARMQALAAEVRSYEAELQSYDSGGMLLNKRLDVAQREFDDADKRVRALREVVSARRTKEAQKAAADAQKALDEAMQTAPEALRAKLQKLAEDNAALADMRTGMEGIAGKLTELTRELQNARDENKRMASEEAGLRARVAAGGLNDALGRLLFRYRSMLPVPAELAKQRDDHEAMISKAELDAIDLREQRQTLTDVDAAVKSALGEIGEGRSDAERARIEKAVRNQYTNRRNLLDAALRDTERLASVLNDLRATDIQLAAQAASLSAFINENLLWVRGDPLWRLKLPKAAGDALKWLRTPSSPELGNAIREELIVNVPLYIAAVLSLGLFVGTRRRMVNALEAAGDRAKRQWHTRYTDTFESLFYTALLALPVPSLLMFLSWRFGLLQSGGDWPRAMSQGLYTAAQYAAGFAVAFNLLRPKGLADAHFDWASEPVKQLRRWLTGMAFLLVPSMFMAITLTILRSNETWNRTLSRFLILIALTVAAAGFFQGWRLLIRITEQTPHMNNVLKTTRLRVLGYLCVAGLPLVLLLTGVFGYYYAGRFFAWRHALTLFWGMIAATGVGMLHRWLIIARRRIALSQTRRAKSEEGQPEDSAVEAALELVRVDEQTQRLVRAAAFVFMLGAVYYVWNDFFSTLSGLDKIHLWPASSEIERVVQAPATIAPAAAAAAGTAAAAATPAVETHIEYVTAADALRGAIILMLTWLAVHNVPRVLEIVMLQRFKMGPGERYAILGVTRYALITVGLVVGSVAIGVRWSSVQWLVAAFGVGLGFGLQEIFANLVSGIILLFERPIRVGDIVTIGDVSGTVSQIRLRATTIMNWDRKELIVPNKDFITGKLLNWTLTDRVSRVVVKVSVAFGTDLEKATRILREITANDHRLVAEPAPQVFLVQLADKAINYEVRVFCTLDHASQVQHDLVLNIDKAFREAGIDFTTPADEVRIAGLKDFAPRAAEAVQKAGT